MSGRGNGNGPGDGNGTGRTGNGRWARGNGDNGPRPDEDIPESEAKMPEGQSRTTFGSRMSAAGMPAERAKDFGGSLGRLAHLMRKEMARVITVLCLAVASVTLTVIGPRLLGHATNIVVQGAFSPRGIDFPALHRTLLRVVLLYAVAAGLAIAQGRMLAAVVQRTMQRLRSAVEDKLNALPLQYIDTTPRGDLLSRVTNDIDNVQQSLQQSLSQMLTSLLTILGVVIMMFTISWPLAVIALVTIPVSILLTRVIAKRSKRQFIAQWTRTGDLNAQVEEAFTGHTLVKVFGRQGAVEETFRRTNDDLYDASFKAQFISGTIQPMMMFLGNLNFVAIAVIGGLRVTSGQMTIGDIQAFIQYSRQFTQPLTQLAAIFNVLQSGIASVERVFELLDAEAEVPDAAVPLHDDQPRGRVVFEHVRFSYSPDKPLITDLSLVAEPGQTIAIVGPTGAGKTTLVNLLMRFYDIQGGTISLDGNDISKMTRRELRSNLGMVLQDTWLFGGTIRDNIAYGNLDAGEDDILAAAKACYVDRFVHSLPHGYDTVVDDEGGSISAGEKQLLTIARAFLSDPTILILDEATSSVDTRTELLLQQAMHNLRSDRTSFVIAHRLSTIRDA
ncbi:MAG TPA: ABC transporter ATP-binding protein, partial [Acidimicrobiales bacterium]|nr:ABC transporter ATP-binding protein [Acidimicrobiales bacterium]